MSDIGPIWTIYESILICVILILAVLIFLLIFFSSIIFSIVALLNFLDKRKKKK